MRIGPPLSLDSLFAANPDPAESDPAKLDGAGLKAALPGWDFQYEADWRRLLRGVAAVGRRGELHRLLLYGVLIAADRRIGHGLEIRAHPRADHRQ